MSFECPNSHPCTRETGNADFLGAWMRQAQRVSSVANVCSEHLLLHHTVTLYTPIKFTQRPSLFARYAQNRYEQLANHFERLDVMTIISQELGHFRPDITEVYLR